MKCSSSRLLAFNAQAVADLENDLLVAIDVVNDASDNHLLVHMSKLATENTGEQAELLLADGGYASGLELQKAEQQAITALVCMPTPEKAAKGVFPKALFLFNAERNEYTCPQKRSLRVVGTQSVGKAGANDYRVTVYECKSEGCPVRASCTTAKTGNRTIKRAEHDGALERARQLYEDPAMRERYRARAALIEHHFGNVKGNHGFRRFTVRGLLKAKAQWALAALAVNLKKLHALWLQGRFEHASTSGRQAA